jgi:chromosomal replication initiation ATPase DnaA
VLALSSSSRHSQDTSLTQVAEYFGRDVTTLSRGVRRIEEKIQDAKIAKKLDELYNAIEKA